MCGVNDSDQRLKTNIPYLNYPTDDVNVFIPEGFSLPNTEGLGVVNAAQVAVDSWEGCLKTFIVFFFHQSDSSKHKKRTKEYL